MILQICQIRVTVTLKVWMRQVPLQLTGMKKMNKTFRTCSLCNTCQIAFCMTKIYCRIMSCSCPFYIGIEVSQTTTCRQKTLWLRGPKHTQRCIVEEGAPVTRPVGVLDPAPPKGCSCVGSDARFCPNPQTPGSVRGVPPESLFVDSRHQLGPTWSNLAVLSGMFVYLVQPGSYLAPT